MSPTDYVTPNSALATALITYPFVFGLSTSFEKTTAQRFVLTRESISAAHAALISIVAASELYHRRRDWLPSAYYGNTASHNDSNNGTETSRPRSSLIETQSTLGDSIVSWECGYLLADFLILSLGTPRPSRHAADRSLLSRSVNWRVLGFHHLGIGISLVIYHLRAVKAPVKGVMVMLMLILMNAS